MPSMTPSPTAFGAMSGAASAEGSESTAVAGNGVAVAATTIEIVNAGVLFPDVALFPNVSLYPRASAIGFSAVASDGGAMVPA